MTAAIETIRKRPKRARHTMKTIFTEVTAVQEITPRLKRVTFGSSEFDRFVTPFPDQFATLIFPLAGQERPLIEPVGFNWVDFQKIPEEVRPIARNYTVRRVYPERGELDIDFVLHEAYGFGADWAARAEPGMIAGMWGPRVGYNPDESVAWQLLVGDETAVPAIGAILEALPAGARATVIIEVADHLDEIELPTRGDIDLRWLHRQPGTHGEPDLLLNAVREQVFPDGPMYVWAAGEIGLTTRLNHDLRRERGLKTPSISAIGYWRRDDSDQTE